MHTTLRSPDGLDGPESIGYVMAARPARRDSLPASGPYRIGAPRVPRRERVNANGGLVAMLIVLGIGVACIGVWAWRTFA